MRRHTFVWGLLIFILVGCSQKINLPNNLGGLKVVHVNELTDTEKVDLLRREAHKRGLRWRIFCTEQFEDEHRGSEAFLAAAWPVNGEDSNRYDRWLEYGGTQAEAALNLYNSIQQGPTHPAEPSPAERDKDAGRKRKMCPLELRGE